MTERTRDNSDKKELKIIIPSDTLPPERKGRESGRFQMRPFLERHRVTPVQLRNPQLGGMVLNNLDVWENLLPEIQKEIMSHILDFIARTPIPPNEDIIAEIERSSARAETTIKVRNLLNRHDSLPRIIKTAIMSHLEEELKTHPDMLQSETLKRSQKMINEAFKKIHDEVPKKGKSMAGRYCIIAGEVINTQDKKNKLTKRPLPPPENSFTEDDDPPTSPGTPNALRRLK